MGRWRGLMPSELFIPANALGAGWATASGVAYPFDAPLEIL
jgi:hypothetical protein